MYVFGGAEEGKLLLTKMSDKLCLICRDVFAGSRVKQHHERNGEVDHGVVSLNEFKAKYLVEVHAVLSCFEKGQNVPFFSKLCNNQLRSLLLGEEMAGGEPIQEDEDAEKFSKFQALVK